MWSMAMAFSTWQAWPTEELPADHQTKKSKLVRNRHTILLQRKIFKKEQKQKRGIISSLRHEPLPHINVGKKGENKK